MLLPQVPDALIDPTSVTRCFRITKQIGMLATGLPGKLLLRWHAAGMQAAGWFAACVVVCSNVPAMQLCIVEALVWAGDFPYA